MSNVLSKVCSNCSEVNHYRRKVCAKCGTTLMQGRPVGTSKGAGFAVSTGGTSKCEGFYANGGRPRGE